MMDLKADGVVLKWTAVSLAMLTPLFFFIFFFLLVLSVFVLLLNVGKYCGADYSTTLKICNACDQCIQQLEQMNHDTFGFNFMEIFTAIEN